MPNPGKGTEGRAVVYSNTIMEDPVLVSPNVGDECGLPSTSPITPRTPNQRGGGGAHHSLSHLQLAGWLVSANPTRQWEFQSKLKTYYCQHGENKPSSSSYESAWRQWCSWCDKQQLNPLQASIQHVVNFVAYHFEAGKEYRTINVYRSALPTTLPKLEGVRATPLSVSNNERDFSEKTSTPKILLILGYINCPRVYQVFRR